MVRAVPVDLEREHGANEKLKVGAVIQRELLLAAARSGVVVGAPPMRIGRGPDSGPHRVSPRNSLMETPGTGGSTNINPVTPRMPFPYPYPRPHP